MVVNLGSPYSYAGCWFDPGIWNNWDSDDVWNIALDIWCHDDAYGTLTDEVMMWSQWKGLDPIGSRMGNRGGFEYWEGFVGTWTVRTLRRWGESGAQDCKQLCITAGVESYKELTAIHAGAEVSTGSAGFGLWGYNTWWGN